MSEPVFITYQQAGQLLQVSAWTIRRMVDRGELQAFKLGSLPGASVRVRRSDVLALMTPAA